MQMSFVHVKAVVSFSLFLRYNADGFFYFDYEGKFIRSKKLIKGLLCILAVLLIFCAVDVAREKSKGIFDGISFSGAYTDRDGTLLHVYLTSDEAYRIYKPVAEYPAEFIDALLLQEDRRFYLHHGINPASLFRAFWETYIKRSRVIGASTITMQTAKLKYKLYTRNLRGKLLQIVLALRLELLYSKQEILDAYVNLAPCGKNIEGFEAASYYFFGKSVEKIDTPQQLMLCVLPQNPTKRCPSINSVPQELIDARLRLFDEWTKAHPEDEATRAFVEAAPQLVCAFPFSAPHYTRMLELGRGDDRSASARSASLTSSARPQKIVKTTLDGSLQQLFESRIAFFVKREQHLGIKNAAALLVDSRNMETLAAVGSAGFFDDEIQGQVDANISKRSPGSALKPFVYALALDQGLIHYDTMLKDTPSSFNEYTPDNYGNTFKGPIKAWRALTESRNIPALALAQKLANPDLYDFLESAGIAELKEKDNYGLSIVLGSADVTPFELASLYCMLVNDGELKPIRVAFSDADGELLINKNGDSGAADSATAKLLINNFATDEYFVNRGTFVNRASLQKRKLLSEEACFIVRKMLEQNPAPVETRPAESRLVPLGYKTGTSVGFRDAWTVGFFDRYVLCVWVGNFDGVGNNAFLGRTAAAPLFFAIADAMIADGRCVSAPSRPPAGVKKIAVCAVSGNIPNADCPTTEESWFIPGVSPIEKCRIHRKITIDTRTGFRTDETDAPYCKTVVREFWPSDLQQLFAQAGLPRLPPPNYAPEQKSATEKNRGSAFPPEIRSPLEGTEYIFRASDPKRNTLILSATADADTHELFWFSGSAFICKSAPGEQYEWSPEPGVYELTVADSKGRSDSRVVTIKTAE